jgi:26S proteasome regulatory subunit N13
MCSLLLEILISFLQDGSTARDAEFVENLNKLLQGAGEPLNWSSDNNQNQASTSTSSSYASIFVRLVCSLVYSTTPSTFQATPEQLAQLQAAIASIAGASTPSQPPGRNTI